MDLGFFVSVSRQVLALAVMTAINHRLRLPANDPLEEQELAAIVTHLGTW